jgi:hypothetical protein
MRCVVSMQTDQKCSYAAGSLRESKRTAGILMNVLGRGAREGGPPDPPIIDVRAQGTGCSPARLAFNSLKRKRRGIHMSDMGMAKRTARARADRLMAIERARDPLLTKVRSAVGSTRANPVFGTRPLREDIEAAGQGTSAYAGQTLLRGEQVRKDMARRVRALASDDRASRTALKIFGREDTPAPARALIKKERESVLPTPGSGGTANRTNAGWDRGAGRRPLGPIISGGKSGAGSSPDRHVGSTR